MSANDYYTPSGTPATGAFGASAPIRSEYTAIGAGFNKLPSLTNNAGKAVVVNPGATALTVTTGTLALAGNFATTGAFNTTLAQSASITLTLPGSSGTLATLAGSETLTNKVIGSGCTGGAGLSVSTAATASAAPASGITGTTLASNVTASSLTSFGSGATLNAPIIVQAGPFGTITPTTYLNQASVDLSADTSTAVIISRAAGTCTVTLPSPSGSFDGRWLLIKTIQNQAVVSASGNVIPIGSSSAGTAILSGTAGKWALLVFNGFAAGTWTIMATG